MAGMKDGLILVNLGTPESPSVPDVRMYLREFLMDPYVIDTSALTRFLLVNAIIAPFRARKSAKLYQKIWMEKGSPLKIYSENLTEKVSKHMGESWKVRLAMRYGGPTIADAVKELAADKDINRVYVIPLYPQYAWASTESVVAKTRQILKKNKIQKAFYFLPYYYGEKNFIQEVAKKAKKDSAGEKIDHWLFSYHGVPKRQILRAVTNSDSCCKAENCCEKMRADNQHCYRAQCFATTRLVAEQMGLKPSEYSVSFQSRLGRTEWIKPYTDHVLNELPERGIKKLAVISPSFAVDCLETLEEINITYREKFLAKGGKAFQYIECLNATESWAKVLASYPSDKYLPWRRF